MTAKIGTTKATFDSKVPVGSGIDHKIAKDAYDNLGKTYLGLVELQVVERTEPYDFDVDSKVKLRVTSIELALDEEHVDELRQQMADVYASRTGKETLFDTAEEKAADPYSYLHAKGNSPEPGVETSCGLRATFDKTLATTPNDDKVTCPDCLAALRMADENALHIDNDNTDQE